MPLTPTDPTQHTAQNLRLLSEMAELGMELVRLAAARAREDLSKPTQPETEQPQPAEPQTAPRPQPTEIAKPRAKGQSLPTLAVKPICPARLFIHLTTAVRACIADQTRLLAPTQTAPTTLPTPSASALRADPRRADLLEGFRLITDPHPQKLDLRRETMALMDHELAADPHQTLDMPTLLFRICDELNIEIDFALLPDKYLGAPDPQATPPPHPP